MKRATRQTRVAADMLEAADMQTMLEKMRHAAASLEVATGLRSPTSQTSSQKVRTPQRPSVPTITAVAGD